MPKPYARQTEKRAAEREPVLHPRIRILDRGAIVMGPGKADLLEAIQGTGSISEAAHGLNMSYMRAWTLIRVMNEAFREPLVMTVRGGKSRGGARLSNTGQEVLALYRAMEKASLTATTGQWRRLKACLR